MFLLTELSAKNAGAWLLSQGLSDLPFPEGDVLFTELGGGISNKVILAHGPRLHVVIKQSLGRLRVHEEWLSDRNRIFREASAMRWLPSRVQGGRVPGVLTEDATEFAIAMEAAPPEAEMWKTRLFRGEMNLRHAEQAGALLASVISESWNHPEARSLFGDQTVFEQLRIEPYYRFTAARRPEAAPYIRRLIDSSARRRVSLVHGDWSPKNLLVGGAEIWAIDWEVVHFGDPSFDIAFLWNHLLMKSIAMPQSRVRLADLASGFTRALTAGLPRESAFLTDAALEHLPALLLARVDGKSPAEYFDGAMRDRARALALDLISKPAASIHEIFER